MAKETLGEQIVKTEEEHRKNFQVEAGELVNAFGPQYMEELEKAILQHSTLTEKFYIQVISKHLIFAPTRGMTIHFFVRRTKPEMNHSEDVWSYDPHAGQRRLEWSLPHALEMQNFLKDPHKYSPKLIADIKAYLLKNH